MSDSIGLYVRNPVTQMGFPIGTVRRIEPQRTDVKVVFTLESGRRIPHDVRAVTRSTSILADRALELVGNYAGGTQLAAAECIPLERSSTPLSIARIIGSATDFVNGINPEGSTNVQDALRGINEAVAGNGDAADELLTRSSRLLENPDQTVSELGEITRNVAQLTSMLRDNREPLKEVLVNLPHTTQIAYRAVEGASKFVVPFAQLFTAANDIELETGTELQLALDTTADLLRVASPHYKGIANILNPLPRFISGLNGESPGVVAGGLAKHLNNHAFNLLPWRPPLYRIPVPNGLLACGMMNSSMPGSCADVAGRPYAVDVALLQYVLTEAQRQ